MFRKLPTVTQEGMTPLQPGTSVSSTSGTGINGAILHVSRYYPNVPNTFGGKGRFKACDCDGMLFPSSDAAHQFAFERGYTRVFISKR